MKRGEFFNRLCGGHFQSFARIRDRDIWYAGGFLGRAIEPQPPESRQNSKTLSIVSRKLVDAPIQIARVADVQPASPVSHVM